MIIRLKRGKVYKTILFSLVLLKLSCGTFLKDKYHGESEFKNIEKNKYKSISKEKG
ncbi:hypothetical protein BOFE_09300 (plasmid) [Candidatus Borrelia fainii]|uniref:Lipoprotein n=1 Tax=Candidatus Borrelia fainii TaxID=2518322 RepID=A0ABM8DLC5_9SPIR|nr:hypothetical protein [Candidatus Borrelia fainii]BDU63390.1 hypothetical protein BOFE_09300 [Candidatus Borrelia fainii]